MAPHCHHAPAAATAAVESLARVINLRVSTLIPHAAHYFCLRDGFFTHPSFASVTRGWFVHFRSVHISFLHTALNGVLLHFYMWWVLTSSTCLLNYPTDSCFADIFFVTQNQERPFNFISKKLYITFHCLYQILLRSWLVAIPISQR